MHSTECVIKLVQNRRVILKNCAVDCATVYCLNLWLLRVCVCSPADSNYSIIVAYCKLNAIMNSKWRPKIERKTIQSKYTQKLTMIFSKKHWKNVSPDWIATIGWKMLSFTWISQKKIVSEKQRQRNRWNEQRRQPFLLLFRFHKNRIENPTKNRHV